MQTISNQMYDVKRFGAKGDGVTDDTAAIQAAVDCCASEGGGQVNLEPGVYISGAIFLKQNVHFHIEAGATLKGKEDPAAYPLIDTRSGGFEMPWPAALLNAIDLEGVRIHGAGKIDGSGLFWWEQF